MGQRGNIFNRLAFPDDEPASQAGRRPQSAADIQAIAGQQTAQQAQAGAQQAQQAQQRAAQTYEMQSQQQSLDFQRNFMEKQQRLAEMQRTNQEQFGNLSRELEATLLQEQLQFQKDEIGRTLFTERQLLDYKVSQAKTQNDMEAYRQQVSLIAKRKRAILDTLRAQVEMQLKNEFQKAEQEKDQALTEKLYRAKAELERRLAEERAGAMSRGMMFQGMGTLVGIGAGIALAPATGGMSLAVAGSLGGAMGGGFGTTAGGIYERNR